MYMHGDRDVIQIAYYYYKIFITGWGLTALIDCSDNTAISFDK